MLPLSTRKIWGLSSTLEPTNSSTSCKAQWMSPPRRKSVHPHPKRASLGLTWCALGTWLLLLLPALGSGVPPRGLRPEPVGRNIEAGRDSQLPAAGWGRRGGCQQGGWGGGVRAGCQTRAPARTQGPPASITTPWCPHRHRVATHTPIPPTLVTSTQAGQQPPGHRTSAAEGRGSDVRGGRRAGPHVHVCSPRPPVGPCPSPTPECHTLAPSPTPRDAPPVRLGPGPAGPGVLPGCTGVRVMWTPPSELPGTFLGKSSTLGSGRTRGSFSSRTLVRSHEVSTGLDTGPWSMSQSCGQQPREAGGQQKRHLAHPM